MKKVIIFLLMLVIAAHGFTQTSDLFKIIDVEIISANNIIVSCRDDYGRTIQFQAGSPLLNIKSEKTENNLKTFRLEQPVIPDFGSNTVSTAHGNQFKIISPVYHSGYVGTIGYIEPLMDMSGLYNGKGPVLIGASFYIQATEFNHFKIVEPLPNGFQSIAAYGRPVYKKFFKNKSGINKGYAILKPSNQQEINNNIFYSYEFIIASNNTPTTTTQGTTSSMPSFDSSQVEVRFISNSQDLPFLYLNAGTDVECGIKIYSTMDIYQHPEHKLLYSSDVQRNFSLGPGTFDAEISGMSVKNVPVYILSSSRIKAGALHFNSTSLWTLYDRNKVKIIYSSSLPKKVEFPVGVYQLETNGIIHQIEIKDGETLEFIDSSQTAQRLNTNSPDNKVIKPEVSNLVPIENGYESVKIFARINNDEEMEVRVNGRVVGKYSQTVGVNMENFLKRNAINIISFKFNDEAKSSSYVELSGKFPGDADFTPIFNFNPKAGKTQGQFEVPFAGKKK